MKVSTLSLLVDPWTISQNSPGLVFLAVPVTSHLCATSVLSSASYIAAWLMLQNADFFLLPCTYACVLRCVLLFCNPMDCSPPGSSVSGILQARILEWVVIPFSRGSSQPRDWTWVSCISCIGSRILYHWASWECPSLALPVYFFLLLLQFFGEGNSNPLQYSCLENAMDRGAWWATVHGVVKSWTQLNTLGFHLQSTIWSPNTPEHHLEPK